MSMDLEEQYDKIYRYCYFRLRQRELAEDITQETFLRFLDSSQYRDTGRALRYLYTIARNLCIDHYRRQGTELLAEEDVFSETAEKAVGNGEDSLLTAVSLRIALEKLSEEERELLLLRYVNEVPVSAICGILGISRFAVYRKTNCALKELRKYLREEDFM